MNIYQKLENIVSQKNISNNIIVRHAYSRNVDPVLQDVPDIVIRPKDAQEISEILKVPNEENVPVTPRGAGGGLKVNFLNLPLKSQRKELKKQ